MRIFLKNNPPTWLRRPFGAGTGEGLGNHLHKAPLVNTDILAATTPDFMAGLATDSEVPDDPVLVTAQHLAKTYLVIFPKFGLAGCTPNNQHRVRALINHYSVE
jgi:hypothetical protein